MQIESLHKNIYTLCRYGNRHESNYELKKSYKEAIKKFEKLKRDNAKEDTKKLCRNISRATYFRYKKKLKLLDKGHTLPTRRPHKTREKTITKEHKDLILDTRKSNPTYGKFKIYHIIKRENPDIKISESSVGRIISHLIGKKIVNRSISANLIKKKKRKFDKHAKRWKYGQKSTKPGELIQIDHMSVNINTKTFKHFQAYDPLTKILFAHTFSSASSNCAKEFLKKAKEFFKFNIASIQVDGGSEFMAHFEDECSKNNIDLFVLPPKSPKYNGGVERANRTLREEFYAITLADTCKDINVELIIAIDKYNNYRPHSSLKGLTPFAYYNSIAKEAA